MSEKANEMTCTLIAGGWSAKDALRRDLITKLIDSLPEYEWIDCSDSFPFSVVKGISQGPKVTKSGSTTAEYFHKSEYARTLDAAMIVVLEGQTLSRPVFSSVCATTQLRGVLLSTKEVSHVLWQKTVFGSYPLKAQYKECLADNGLLPRKGLQNAIGNSEVMLRDNLNPPPVVSKQENSKKRRR